MWRADALASSASRTGRSLSSCWRAFSSWPPWWWPLPTAAQFRFRRTGDLRFSLPWVWAPARSPPPSPFAPCAAARPRARRRRRDGRAAQEPAHRRGHHQSRAAGAGILGARPGRARDDAYAGEHFRPAAAPRGAAEIRQMARPCLGSGAEEWARRALFRRTAVHLVAEDRGGRPRRGRRSRGGRAGDLALARHRRAQARPRPHPRSAPPAGARYARRTHPAQRAADAGLVSRCRRAYPMDQRGLCEGRGGR